MAAIPRAGKAVGGLQSIAWWKWVTGLLMAYVCYGAFFIANAAQNFTRGGDDARIVFFHVPAAIMAYVGYVVATVYSVQFLTKSPTPETDAKAAIGMELGFVFCIIATITGSVFAGAVWGSYWNWDPRETSIVVMLLLYASYLILRGVQTGDMNKRGRLSAVYALVSIVPATFLIWVVPRVTGSLHPRDTLANPSGTSIDYKMVLYPSFIAFAMLFTWLFQLRLRAWKVGTRRQVRRIRSAS
jgi:heme exporter protein C